MKSRMFDGGEEESVIKTIKGDITKIHDVLLWLLNSTIYAMNLWLFVI